MDIEEREKAFKNSVFRMISFPAEVQEEFFEYWSEPSKSGKMRFEMEKTWDLNRRLKRWQRENENRKDFVPRKAPVIAHTSVKQPLPAPTNEVERLDHFLRKYIDRPTDIPFAEFGVWFDYMKKEKLLKPMFQKEIDELKEIYNCDNSKCRCAAVQITLDGYVKGGITFAEIFKMRLKMA